MILELVLRCLTLFNTEILDTGYFLTYTVDLCMFYVISTQDDADETLQWSSNAETECEDLESGGEEYQPRGRNAQRQAQLLREYQPRGRKRAAAAVPASSSTPSRPVARFPGAVPAPGGECETPASKTRANPAGTRSESVPAGAPPAPRGP